MADDIAWPDWTPGYLRHLPREVVRVALRDTWGRLEAKGCVLGEEMAAKFPDVMPLLAEVESINDWQTKIATFLDKMEGHDRPRRKVSLNRRIDEVEVLFEPPSPKHSRGEAGAA